MTTNRAVKSCSPVINYLVRLRLGFESGETPQPDFLRNKLKAMIGEVESELQIIPEMYGKIDTIKYVLTGFCDEVLIFSDKWEYAARWREHPLEMEFFGTNIAGERFYSHLEQKAFADMDPELAELFYICLSLGFRGEKRGGENEPEIIDLKRRLYVLIPNRIADDDRQLSPRVRTAVTGKDDRLPPMFGFWTILAVLLVIAGFYITAGKWLWDDAAEIIRRISDNLITRGY